MRRGAGAFLAAEAAEASWATHRGLNGSARLNGILRTFDDDSVFLLIAGFVIEKPNPVPDVFGFHEIWHLLVVVAAFLHYLLLYLYVLPA